MELLSGIVSRAKELFITCGVKSVTMDDLASDMGMSKKTLYQYIPSKAKLIERMVQIHIKEEKKALADIRNKSTNAIEEMILISQYVIQLLRMVSPNVIFEIKKYYWESWQKMEKLNNEHILEVIKQNLHRGIDQGHYRKDLNTDIISQHYVTLSSSLVDHSVFPHNYMSMEKIFLETIRYHLRGITTNSGWEICQKKLTKLTNA